MKKTRSRPRWRPPWGRCVPNAPSVYCECEFHDAAEGAKWIVEHTTDIGEAIAKGLC